jgi:hypothetical protein
MTLKAVTFNLGGAGPRSGEYRSAAFAWSAVARGHYDIVFAQEIHDDEWLDDWRDDQYKVIEGAGPRYKARSAVLVANSLELCSPVELLTAEYHGSYVAVASIVVGLDAPVVLASIHASPNEVKDEWLGRWPRREVPVPFARARFRLWDADMVLESMRVLLRTNAHLVVAGDWNEARLWDATHSGEAGKQFFDRVAESGLVDCAHSEWGKEFATHDHYQLDHVFATSSIAPLIRNLHVVDDVGRRGGSDHKPIEFEIDV